MKYRIGILIVCSIVITILSTAPLYRTALGEIEDLYITENGEIFYLQEKKDGSKSLFHLREDGTILSNTLLSEEEDGLSLEGRQLVADDSGNCYVWLRQYQDRETTADYIQIYDAKGKEGDRLFYQGDGRNIQSLQRYQNEIIVFLQPQKGEEQLEILRYHFKTGKEETLCYPLGEQKEDYFEECVYAGEQAVFLLTDEGNLFHMTEKEPIPVPLPKDNNGIEVIPYLLSAAEGVIYFTDGRNFDYYAMQADAKNFQLLCQKEGVLYKTTAFSDVRGVRIQGNYLTAYYSKEDSQAHSFILKASSHKEGQILQWRQIEKNDFIKFVLIRFFLAVLGCTPVYVLCWWLWDRKSLMVKLVLLIFPLMAALSLFLSYLFKNSYSSTVQQEIYDQLYMAVYAAKNNLDIQDFKTVSLPLKKESQDYKNQDYIRFIIEFLNQRKEKEVYLTFYLIQEETAYVFLDLNVNSSYGTHLRSGILEELTEPKGDYVPWFLTKDEINHTELFDPNNNSEWIYYAQTIRDDTGVCGYIEAGMNKMDLINKVDEQCDLLSVLVILAVLGVMLVILFGIGGLLYNLRILKQGVIKIASGDWGTVVDIVSRDEMQEIGNSFNRMSDQIVRHLDSIEKIQKTYERFTPKQILNLLEVDNVLEAVPGKHIVKPLFFLSVNLKDPMLQVEFSYLNEWIHKVTSQISRYGGVVESFQEDKIQAVFPTKQADTVLEAAVSIMEEMKPQSNVCITIQGGEMTFGVVGDQTRTSTMLIAQAVSQNDKLVQFAQKNRIPVLVTEDILEKITAAEEFFLRGLGKLQMGNEGVAVYELCNGYPNQLYELRKKTSPRLGDGIKKYQAGQLQQARRDFIDVIRIDHTDETAKMYLFLCERYEKEKPTNFQGWID